jgi:hypothetical protein
VAMRTLLLSLPGAKGKYQNLAASPKELFALFMTYSFDLRRHLRDGTVIYNP